MVKNCVYTGISFIALLLHAIIITKRDKIGRGIISESEVILIEKLKIPSEILERIKGMSRTQHTAGMSGALVYTYYDDEHSYVLKIQKEDRAEGTHLERKMLPWLYGKVPVPKVWHAELVEGYSYILMDVARGTMANDTHWLSKGENFMIQRLAEGLKLLWQVDTADCPVKITLDDRLKIASYRVHANLVDMSVWVAYNTFSNPTDLLHHLYASRPQTADYVLVQGDYCLPNIFLDEQGISGFVDFGRAGIAERYQDIALCIRTINHNFGFKELKDDDRVSKLFAHLEMTPDYEKIEYFILLNELF